ncbi:MAG: hypothetical protein HY840_12580 [Bacteroidetes bacterium]|nr:hypothetical protein [Bacteroidota bacterium]
MSGSDTAVIKKFDGNGNLTFHKIFPSYGIAMILAYSYTGKHLDSYTWAHSNIGFVETEYEYDTLKNIKIEYSYEREKITPLPNLMKYYSLDQLKKSKSFKKYKNPKNRYKASVKYFEDTLLIKEDGYKPDGSINNTTQFTYKNGQLVERNEVYGNNKTFNKIIYSYDKLGNEVKWMKIFNSTDTAYIYNKRYEAGLIKEVNGIERGKLKSTELYDYSDGKLNSIKNYDSKETLKISSEYHYNKDGTIDYLIEVNNYMSHKWITKYYY